MSFSKEIKLKYGYGLTPDDVNELSDPELTNTDYSHLEIYLDKIWAAYQSAQDKMKGDTVNIIQLDIDAGAVNHISDILKRVRTAADQVLKESGQSKEVLLENERVARCMIGTDILENDLKASDFASGSPHRALFGEMRKLYENVAKELVNALNSVRNDEAYAKSYNYWSDFPDWLDRAWKGELKN